MTETKGKILKIRFNLLFFWFQTEILENMFFFGTCQQT